VSSKAGFARLRPERAVNISFPSFPSKSWALEHKPGKAFGGNDIDQKYRSHIVPTPKVSFPNQSIVPTIVPTKTHTQKGFQEYGNDVNDMNDIFTPLSAQPNFANFLANCGGTR
jgi:hypothetical protein